MYYSISIICAMHASDPVSTSDAMQCVLHGSVLRLENCLLCNIYLWIRKTTKKIAWINFILFGIFRIFFLCCFSLKRMGNLILILTEGRRYTFYALNIKYLYAKCIEISIHTPSCLLVHFFFNCDRIMPDQRWNAATTVSRVCCFLLSNWMKCFNSVFQHSISSQAYRIDNLKTQ